MTNTQHTPGRMKPASWVIIDMATGKAVMETYFEKTAEQAAATGHYRAVPILKYLQALNQSLKEAQ